MCIRDRHQEHAEAGEQGRTQPVPVDRETDAHVGDGQRADDDAEQSDGDGGQVGACLLYTSRCV